MAQIPNPNLALGYEVDSANPDILIDLAGQESVEIEKQIEAEMYRFNDAHAGPNDGTRLVFAARDSGKQLIGGLVAYVYWNNLSVDLLWVDERYRLRRIGRSLMIEAETEARRRGLEGITLNTFSFAAPGFYKKLGFEEYAHLTGIPKGVTRHLFCKWLRTATSS